MVLHVQLVGEATEELLDELRRHGLDIDEDLVRLGVAVHDAGKILHSDELDAPGDAHEPAGEKLLLEAGVQPDVARCCLSHARYDSMQVSFEELLVALSDKLWKGVRAEALELRIIDAAAAALDQDRWDLFADLDACFERIAAKGDERLVRSRSA